MIQPLRIGRDRRRPSRRPSRHLSRGRQPRRAMALVVVMVTVLLVALAAYGFNHQMTDAYRASRMQTERAQARLAALSGIESTLALAEMPRDARRQRLASTSNPFHAAVERGEAESAGDESARWSFAVITAAEADSPVAMAESSSAWRFGWVSESEKLNIPMLREQNRQFPGHARQALLNLPGASPAEVDAFLLAQGISDGTSKQRDLVDEITSRGSVDGGESSPKRLARLWTGGDWNHDYRLDPLERALGDRAAGTASHETLGRSSAQDGSRGGSAVLAWRDFLTFSSGQRNENRNGRPRIFLNTADLTRLHQQLEAILPSGGADFIILARQFGLASTGSSGSSEATVANLDEASEKLDLSKPATKSILNPLDLIDAQVRIARPDQQDLWVKSPFRGASLGAGDYLTSLVDDVTVDPNPVINGQIDVSQAPREVLLGIPGLSEETAEQILQARRSPPTVAAPRDTIAWLLREQVIELPTLRQLFPWITVGGDCFHAQVIGYRDPLSPLFRCTVTFDGRGQTARMQDFQQWHHWGRGFDVRQFHLPPTL